MIRCPACRFESPDESLWCQFCKNPFRKDKPRAPAPPPGSEPQGGGPPPDSVKKIIESLPPEVRARIPRSLPVDDEKVPTISQTERLVAWGFLLFWVVAAMILSGVVLARRRVAEELGARGLAPAGAPAQAPAEPAAPRASDEVRETAAPAPPPPSFAPPPAAPSGEPEGSSSAPESSEPPPAAPGLPGPPMPPGR